jgi:hypothetical protein
MTDQNRKFHHSQVSYFACKSGWFSFQKGTLQLQFFYDKHFVYMETIIEDNIRETTHELSIRWVISGVSAGLSTSNPNFSKAEIKIEILINFIITHVSMQQE